MSKYYEYSYVNWENCPFQGQLEVSGTHSLISNINYLKKYT